MKRVIFNSTTIMHDGTVMIQLRKQMSDDGKEWENLDFHRITLPPGGDLDAALPSNDAHLKSMGFKDGLDALDVERCKAHIALAVSDSVPVSDSVAQARIETEKARRAEIDACRAAVGEANKIIEAQAEALELAEPILEAHAAALASEGSKIILA